VVLNAYVLSLTIKENKEKKRQKKKKASVFRFFQEVAGMELLTATL